jgi:LPS-assembly lipoprotein
MDAIDTRLGSDRGLRLPLPGFPVIAMILVSVLLTSACGFKLRGQVDIPPELNPMHIQPGGGSLVRNELIQQLQGSQVQLASEPGKARVIIRLSNESRSSRVAAVDRNGKVLAYELTYQVSFDALSPEGKQLVSPQTVNLFRTYENPDVEVLGKQLEADLIYQDMVQDAAIRILSRLRLVLL